MTDKFHLSFDSIEDEAKYWKNRTIELEAEVSKLKAKRCSNCMLEKEDENQEEPVQKKVRIQENMDPFDNRFPQHCQDLIMSHFHRFEGEDLYKISKVSQEWKQMLNNNKQTADKLKKFLTIETVDLYKLFRHPAQNIVEYAHFNAKFHSDNPENSFLYAIYIERYSPYIETLRISYDNQTNDNRNNTYYYYQDSLLNLTFPRLRSLHIDAFPCKKHYWIKTCQYPALVELTWDDVDIYRNYDDDYDDDYYDDEDDEDEDGIESVKKLITPKLKKLVLGDVPFDKYQELFVDLESLEIKNKYHMNDIEFIMRNMQNLKSLTLGLGIYSYRKNAETTLTANTSITLLNLGRPIKVLGMEMLKKLPALEKLVLYEQLQFYQRKKEDLSLSKEMFNLIVRYNLKLKTIKCVSVEKNLLEEYEELKQTEAQNDEINTNIEIVIL